jgi:DNA (cytosine-5)-methyltransferase 1
MENVAAMVQSKFIKDFHEWQNAVASLGYTHYTDILNSKDFGVAQNRERVFMVSIRNDIGMRYHFPKPFKLEKRLKDVLEENVDEKYYLSDKTIAMFDAHRDKQQALGRGFGWKPTDGGGIAMGIKTSANTRADDNFIINE